METERRKLVTKAWEEGGERIRVWWVSVLQDERFLEMNFGDGCIMWMYLVRLKND